MSGLAAEDRPRARPRRKAPAQYAHIWHPPLLDEEPDEEIEFPRLSFARDGTPFIEIDDLPACESETRRGDDATYSYWSPPVRKKCPKAERDEIEWVKSCTVTRDGIKHGTLCACVTRGEDTTAPMPPAVQDEVSRILDAALTQPVARIVDPERYAPQPPPSFEDILDAAITVEFSVCRNPAEAVSRFGDEIDVFGPLPKRALSMLRAIEKTRKAVSERPYKTSYHRLIKPEMFSRISEWVKHL